MNQQVQSLRDRQKLKRREDMLVAARALFVERGYSKTTMDAIAERAGVGVATVYTYFTNKEGVFAELARMDMSELKAQGEAALESLPADPVEAVQGLLAVYVRVHDYISYEVIRDFYSGARSEGPIRSVALWISDWQRDQLTLALKTGQQAGAVSDQLPAREAAQIICDLLDRYYERARSADSDRRAYSRLKRWVALLFDDWRAAAAD